MDEDAAGVLNGLPLKMAKHESHDEQWVYLVAILDAPFITRTAFEAAMVRFADAGFPHDPQFRFRLGDLPVRGVSESGP